MGTKPLAHPPMVQEVYRALQYVWDNRDPLALSVFTNPKTGKEYNYRSKFLGTICKRLGISKITYHDFRHHTASTLAQKGPRSPISKKFLDTSEPRLRTITCNL